MGRRIVFRLLAALALTVLAGACADGGLRGGQAAVDTGDDGDDDRDDGDDDRGDEDRGDDDDDNGDDRGDGGSSEEFCETLTSLIGGSAPDIDDIEGLADQAPEEIQDDLDVILDNYDELSDGGLDIPADLTEAIVNLGTFVAAECSLDDFDFDNLTPECRTPGCEPDDIPSDTPSELSDLADDCFDGDLAACDELYLEAEIGSDVEDWADRCGGRFDESPGFCSSIDIDD